MHIEWSSPRLSQSIIDNGYYDLCFAFEEFYDIYYNKGLKWVKVKKYRLSVLEMLGLQ